MADYLEPGLLAEAYIHFWEVEYSSDVSELIRGITSERAVEAARERFGEDVRVSVELEPGGLKDKAKVVGATAFGVFLTYGAFRQSVDYMVRDAKWFCDDVIPGVVHQVQRIQQSSYHSERRTGIPGRLREVIRDIDRIPAVRQSAPARLPQFTNDIRIRAERVIDLVEGSESQAIIAAGLEEITYDAVSATKAPRAPGSNRGPQPALPSIPTELDEFLRSLRKRKKSRS